MSFNTGTQSELLYTLTTAVTKNTYTTEAAFTGVLGTNTVCALPAGWLLSDVPNPVGRAVHLEAYGTIATTSAATIAVRLGMDPTAGTINQPVTVSAALAPTAALTLPWRLDAWYTCTAFLTSTATFQVNGTWRVESVASGGTPSASAQCSGFSGTHTGINPAVVNYLELFGTWSASAAGNTTTLQQEFLWGLNLQVPGKLVSWIVLPGNVQWKNARTRITAKGCAGSTGCGCAGEVLLQTAPVAGSRRNFSPQCARWPASPPAGTRIASTAGRACATRAMCLPGSKSTLTRTRAAAGPGDTRKGIVCSSAGSR